MPRWSTAVGAFCWAAFTQPLELGGPRLWRLVSKTMLIGQEVAGKTNPTLLPVVARTQYRPKSPFHSSTVTVSFVHLAFGFAFESFARDCAQSGSKGNLRSERRWWAVGHWMRAGYPTMHSQPLQHWRGHVAPLLLLSG